MKTTIVDKRKIEDPQGRRMVTRWAKQVALALKLKSGEAVRIEFSKRGSKSADNAREGLSALVKRHNLKLKVVKRGNSVFLTRTR